LLPGAEVLLPAAAKSARAKLELQAEPAADGTASTVKLPIDLTRQDTDAVEALLRPGVFEIWMQTPDGKYLVRNLAHDVAASEGNLARVTHQELEEKLQPIKINIQSAQSLTDAGWEPEAASHSTTLLGLLILLLLGEQALAYSASYHVPKIVRGGAA
jgi:hypothetical protein